MTHLVNWKGRKVNMRKILYLCLTIFVCYFFTDISAAACERDSDVGVKWTDSSLQTTLEKAQKENKLVLIDFYSPT